MAFGLHMMGDIITIAMMDSKISSTESTACICVTYIIFIVLNIPIINKKTCTIKQLSIDYLPFELTAL